MRKLVGMVSLAALAACSGQDPQSAGSLAPAGTGTQTVASTGTFVAPTQTKTYQAVGGVQSYTYTYDEQTQPNNRPSTRNQTLQLYSASAATVRSPGITVAYDPRSAQYTLTIAQDSVNQNITFQDPAHRTDFGGAVQPQDGVPNLQNQGVKYLEVRLSGDASTYDEATFFYEQPGTSTKYVTYAGFVRNRYEVPGQVTSNGTVTDLTRKTLRERAAFVYGEQTAAGAVPTTGTATYSGNLIASMVNNPDFENSQQSYFQWINGTQKTTVDFAASTVRTAMTGTVGAPLLDRQLGTAGLAAASVPIAAGSTFVANASARIDTVFTGGFAGQVSDARFTTPGGAVQTVKIEGSSIDGAFYGPKAEEIGASFRIVGGVPDQRVDVIGSFTGARP